VASKQGRNCDCADTFVQGEGGAPVELLKLAIQAEAQYLHEMKGQLDKLDMMREAAARVSY
jgi:hypothetical protein